MKYKFILIILVCALGVFFFHSLITNADSGKKLTLEEKLDVILAKQDDILTKLDGIKEELKKIKIRITRKL